LEINRANLSLLGVAFNTAYQGGLGMADPQWQSIATPVNSTTGTEEYGWIGKLPNVREWIGDRVVQNISTSSYSIKNKTYELTIGVEREHIEDDNLGVYTPLFQEMGQSAAGFPNLELFALLKAGFATACYDKQFFFDTDHPVIAEDGSTASVANTDGGAGASWFLLCTKRALKPLIWQRRKDFQFVAKDRVDDDNVFYQKEFHYGIDGRFNAGFGFWQMAWGSKQTLDAAHYETARAAIMAMKGDNGRPLGLVPDLLVVDPSNEGNARNIVKAAVVNATNNPWYGTADLLVSPWLA
jgi:phage major head subunit gpT-like protein